MLMPKMMFINRKNDNSDIIQAMITKARPKSTCGDQNLWKKVNKATFMNEKGSIDSLMKSS
jgi:hypothetical protein